MIIAKFTATSNYLDTKKPTPPQPLFAQDTFDKKMSVTWKRKEAKIIWKWLNKIRIGMLALIPH